MGLRNLTLRVVTILGRGDTPLVGAFILLSPLEGLLSAPNQDFSFCKVLQDRRVDDFTKGHWLQKRQKFRSGGGLDTDSQKKIRALCKGLNLKMQR